MYRSRLFKITSGLLFLCAFSCGANAQAEPDASTPLLKSLFEQAKNEAQQSFVASKDIENDTLSNLSYEVYRTIQFDPKKAIWHKQRPFEIQLFHPGFLYKVPININTVDWQNKVARQPFDQSKFTYNGLSKGLANSIKTDVGYAGFRVHYPINKPSLKEEFAVFQGATYFRLIGKNQIYGLSARALAIDTGESEGEEFPYFTDFWLVETDNKDFTIYAKLNSPSVTGVFKFVLHPSIDTAADVEGWIFARQNIKKLGLAPFTSMFLYGENSLNKPDDYRPEVHDSDGVVLQSDDNQRVWRPLNNPNRLRITSLSTKQPQGFGMLQRDIQYSHYVDPEANYHMRPGLWVKPYVGFNQGRLETVEIPTNSETHDNIVSYWVNDNPLQKGQSHYVKYSITTTSGNPFNRELAPVIRTLQGANEIPGVKIEEGELSRRFVVDFQKPNVDFDIEKVKLDVSATNARIENTVVFLTNFNSEIRASFTITPDDEESIVDMILALKQDKKTISEVWSYVYER